MGELLDTLQLQAESKIMKGLGVLNLTYDENAERKKQEWFDEARSEYDKIGKGLSFDRLKEELEKKYTPFNQMNAIFQRELTKLVKKDKAQMYKHEKKMLKKEVLGRMYAKMPTEANEIIVEFIKKWYNIKSIRDDNYREMYIYKDGIYTENAQTYIKQICRYCLDTLYTDLFSSKVTAKIEVDSYISHEEFTKVENPFELAVQNGILNLETKELSDFTPDKIFFNKINAVWDKNSECPNFDDFLISILPEESAEENKAMIEELIGFCLVREYFQEKAFLFQGSGRNGKGKLLNVIENLVGSKNVSNIPLEEIKYDGFQIVNLSKKLINIGGDIGKAKLKATQAFKSCTGRDTLAANRKRQSYIHFVNYAKMIFCANTLPETCDDSDGFFDRWEFIDFPYKFVSQDELDSATNDEKKYFKLRNPSIIKEITTKKELNGVLNLAVNGLQRLLKNKSFTGNQTSKQIKEIWQIRNASFQSFMEKYITGSGEDQFLYIEVGALNAEYDKFCKKHKASKQSIREIDTLMSQKFGVAKEIKKINKKTVRIFPYVKFKELEHQQNFNEVKK